MEGIIQFQFRDRQFSATYLISEEAYPTYIYIWFTDDELIQQFGEEVCLHTDGKELLPNHIFSAAREELFLAIFTTIKAGVELSSNPHSKTNKYSL